MTAASVGLMVFGLFAGWIFMTFEYFLILGATSAYAQRLLQRQPVDVPRPDAQQAALPLPAGTGQPRKTLA